MKILSYEEEITQKTRTIEHREQLQFFIQMLTPWCHLQMEQQIIGKTKPNSKPSHLKADYKTDIQRGMRKKKSEYKVESNTMDYGCGLEALSVDITRLGQGWWNPILLKYK